MISLFIIIASMTIFEFYTLRFEYAGKPLLSGDWAVHHDEKLAISDSRFFFLRDKIPMNIMDYQPYPISAAFGIAVPRIQLLGFKLFGMNNIGLRCFFVLSGAATSLLLVLTIMKIAPNFLGFVFSVIYLLCYNNFILNRHAIIENFLVLFLVYLIWLYVVKRDFFLKNLGKICFISGLSVMFKINFPAYVFMFIFIAIITESPRLRTILKFFVWSVSGLVFFELIQLATLHGLHIAHLRYHNLWLTFLQNTGNQVQLMNKALLPYPPSGLFTFLRFPVMLLDWYGLKLNNIPQENLYVVSFAFLLIIAGVMELSARRKAPRQALTLAVSMAAFLALSCNFFFYPKRAVVFYPIALLTTLYLAQNIYAFFVARSRNAKSTEVIIQGLLILLIIPYSYYQLSFFIGETRHANTAIEKNSAELDNDLPAKSVIYTHCYGYRFFWQEKKHQMISCDDQIMTNQMILDWALKNNSKYIIFSGHPETGAAKLSESAFGEKVARWRPLKMYFTSPVESDVADEYRLVEIFYK